MGMNIFKSDKCKYRKEEGLEYYYIDRLEEIQSEMIHLLSIVDDICAKNHIEYWVDGGTLIGTIRHQGFIPWDDDIDISLLKRDYLKLIRCLEDYSKENGNTYLFYSSNENYYHCCNFFASKKNLYTRQKGIMSLYPIKLDIRPVNVIKNTEIEIANNIKYRDIANYYIFHKTYLDKQLEVSLMANDKKTYYKEKRDFLSWYNTRYGLESIDYDNIVCVHPYFDFSKNVQLRREEIFPIKKKVFGGILVSVPNDYDGFLNKFYSNYKELPPLEQRAPIGYEYLSLKNIEQIDVETFFSNQYKEGINMRTLTRAFNYRKILGTKKFIQILLEHYGYHN